jgi:hypothetical protein
MFGPLDHVAFRVDDLDGLAAMLRAGGARFSGPDRRGEICQPFEIATRVTSGPCRRARAGLAVQLIELPAQ